jgi:hypothetical protein
MFIVGMLSWWYTVGWKKMMKILLEKLAMTEDFFSINILISNLFAPFKQISATGYVGGTLQDKMRDWFDKQFSRVFGAAIRIILIVVGIMWLFVQLFFDLILMLIWPVLPILPIVGCIVMFTIGVPWLR